MWNEIRGHGRLTGEPLEFSLCETGGEQK